MAESATDRAPTWLTGQGRGPQLKWHAETNGPGCMTYSRETGELFAGDANGQLSRFDFHGKLLAVCELPGPIVALSWSDDGSQGAAIIGEETVVRLNPQLQVMQTLQPADVCLSLAVSPFGNHLAVGLANGTTQIYNERKRRIARFETVRPLAFLEFCTSEAILFGAAEHGFVGCFNLAGAQIWKQANWSNVGGLSTTGMGDFIYLASFGHGIQVLDADGIAIGSYMLEGTINHVSSSFEPDRLVASTIEGQLYWMNSAGELVWSTTVNDDIAALTCGPLGNSAIIWLAKSGLFKLEWQR